MNKSSNDQQLAVSTGQVVEKSEPQTAEAATPSQRTNEVMLSMSAVRHSGPLPHSSEFKAYEDVLPGAAQQILRMAHEEQDNRFKLSVCELEIARAEVEHHGKERKTSGYIGLIFVGGVVGALLISAWKGQAPIAYAALATTIATMVGRFIYRPQASQPTPAPSKESA